MKLMRYLLTITALIIIFAYGRTHPASADTYFSGCRESFVGGVAPKHNNNTKQIIGLCKGGKINFAVSFNKNRRTADFVAYKINSEMVFAPSTIKRSNSWFSADPDISNNHSKLFQATRATYRRSGFDRGHLIKAEDMKLDTKTYKSTFLFSSIVPQFPKFNRVGWRKAEQLPRTKIKKGIFNEVWIIAGVTGTHPRSIDMDVTVPSCFYRVLIGRNDDSYSVVALLMPNSNSTNGSIVIDDYVVGLNYLEKITNIDLLPDFDFFDFDLTKWGLSQTKKSKKIGAACA